MMTEYEKNILVGALFVVGILSIFSGAFIITVLVFAGIIFFSTARGTPPLES